MTTSEFWEPHEDDSASGLDALDEFLPSDCIADSESLDAFGGYVPIYDDDESGLNALDEQSTSAADIPVAAPATSNSRENMPDMRFSASDPSQRITVTALINGMIDYVALSPRAGLETTERELAAEILAVADVAATKARSAQYELVYEVMRLQGQGRDSIRSVVEGMLHLPTPEQAIATEAEFTTQRTFGQY